MSRLLRVTCLWWLVAACGGSNQAADRRAYVAEVRDPDDAAACERIHDEDLRGECLSMAARAQAGEGHLPSARSVCEKMPDGFWQRECWFEVADGAEATARDARDLCGRTGDMRYRCLHHAAMRQAGRELDHVDPGDEAAAFAKAMKVYEAYGSSRRQAETSAGQLLGPLLADRNAGQPFTARTCGTAPPGVCDEAMETQAMGAMPRDGSWQRECGASLTAATAARVGLPGWDADMEPSVQRMWRRVCSMQPPPP